MKPKKLIRKRIVDKLKPGEWEEITDQDELNKLYALKIREELTEIQASGHKDIMEFVDLIQVAFSFARINGFTHEQLSLALIVKTIDKGNFGRLALNNLNPRNPSNKLYFEDDKEFLCSREDFDSYAQFNSYKDAARKIRAALKVDEINSTEDIRSCYSCYYYGSNEHYIGNTCGRYLMNPELLKDPKECGKIETGYPHWKLNDIDTVGICANCGVEFHIHKGLPIESNPICKDCGKYKKTQGNGIIHQLCECGTNICR